MNPVALKQILDRTPNQLKLVNGNPDRGDMLNVTPHGVSSQVVTRFIKVE